MTRCPIRLHATTTGVCLNAPKDKFESLVVEMPSARDVAGKKTASGGRRLAGDQHSLAALPLRKFISKIFLFRMYVQDAPSKSLIPASIESSIGTQNYWDSRGTVLCSSD